MIIRCWGARGSIPVSGKEFIKYGGDTPCIEIRSKAGEVIVVDAGTGIRRLGKTLMAEQCREIIMFFTHAHWDHLIGFPFFRPIYQSDMQINMFGCPFAQHTIKEMISKVMAAPHFPVDYDDIHCNIAYHETCGETFSLGGLTVTSIPLSHPNQGVGYRFEEDGKSFVFLTDNELTYRHPGGLDFTDYVNFCKGADILIHDAEFTPQDYRKTWGHTIYTDALRLALEAGVGLLGLYHHNQDRTDDDIDKIEADCRENIRLAGAATDCIAVSQETEFVL